MLVSPGTCFLFLDFCTFVSVFLLVCVSVCSWALLPVINLLINSGLFCPPGHSRRKGLSSRGTCPAGPRPRAATAAIMPFRVIQGHHFDTKRKPTCDFPVINANLPPVLHRFHQVIAIIGQIFASDRGCFTFNVVTQTPRSICQIVAFDKSVALIKAFVFGNLFEYRHKSYTTA